MNEEINSTQPQTVNDGNSTNQNYTPTKPRTASPSRVTPTTHSTPIHTMTFMTPQEITERFMEQKLYESPIKWISASKRIYGESEVAEKKAELAVKADRELLRDWTNYDRDRNEYLVQIKKKIHSFKIALDGIKNKLIEKPQFYDKPKEQDNLEQYLEQFENKVASFKLTMKQEFDHLEANEEILLKDIYRVDQLILHIHEEEHGNVGNGFVAAGMMLSPDKEAARAKNAQQNQQRLEEDMEHKAAIGEVDRELAALGKFQGWDPRDHDAFLRVWNGYFGSTEVVRHDGDEWLINISQTQLQHLLKKLEFNVFGKTLDELKDHVEWYSSILRLNAKKKKLLSDWKRVQTIRKKFATQEAAASEQILLSKSKSGDSRDLSNDERFKEIEEKRSNAKMRITKWKNDKQRELELQKLEEEQKNALEQKRSQEERKRRQMEVQVKLEHWKTLKAKEALGQNDPKPEPRHVDEETLRKRAERDLELAKERKQRADLQALKKKERERRLSEIPGSKYNVDSKLHASTKASEAGRIREEDLDAAEHRRHSTGAHGSTVAMNARDLQFTGKATAFWMKPVKV